MLGLTIAGLMASTVAAQPNLIASRQATTEGINKTELEAGPGRDITFIWARASTETGNMVRPALIHASCRNILTTSQGGSLGPMLCDSLKEAYDDANVACQGVGGAYAADLISNLSPLGTSQGAIDEATRLVHLANTKCPDTAVVAGGYRRVNRVPYCTHLSLTCTTARAQPSWQPPSAASQLQSRIKSVEWSSLDTRETNKTMAKYRTSLPRRP